MIEVREDAAAACAGCCACEVGKGFDRCAFAACSVPTPGQLHTLQNAVLSLPAWCSECGLRYHFRLMVTESTETAAETPTELEELRRSGRVVMDDSDAVGGNRYRHTALRKID